MIRFLKQLFNDRRGNAIAVAAMAMPMLVGAAGLATDTIQWTNWKRELQRGADSAAIAGVYAIIADDPSMTAEQAVNADLQKHNTTGIALLAGYPQINYPTGAGYTDAVQVTVAVKKKLGFSSLFLSTPPTIITSATAAKVDSYNYCVVGLSPTGSALLIGGSANVNLGCGAISNSEDTTDSVSVDGTAHYFFAEPVAAAGAIDGDINGAPLLMPESLPMEDPYASLSTTVPAGMSCTNFNSHIVGPIPTGEGGTATLTPGCYSNFNAGNHTYTLNPGVYYLNNTNLNLNGQTRLVGEGVTIILTGSNPGSVSMNGSSSMDLTAPTTGPYAKMVLIQSANATTGNNNTINGDNNTALDGAIYFPKGDLSLTGSTGQAYQCAMIVGWTVEFTGSATVQNNTTGCDAASTVVGKKVRLIA